jgi:P27 family predicted phage terminase small subunit
VKGGALPERVRIPPEVRQDADALELWRELFPLIRGRLVRSDLPAFADLLLTWAEWRRVRRELATTGRTSTGRTKGELVKHPLVTVEAMLETAKRAGQDRFGLSPSGRGRLPEKQEEADLGAELDAWLRRSVEDLREADNPAELVWQVAEPEGVE